MSKVTWNLSLTVTVENEECYTTRIEFPGDSTTRCGESKVVDAIALDMASMIEMLARSGRVDFEDRENDLALVGQLFLSRLEAR
jgi:hypothetical protein